MLSLLALLGSFAYSYFTPTETVFSQMPFTIMTAGFFLAGILFFGCLSFVLLILFGLQLGAEKNVAIFLYIIPSIIATYAGTKLGFFLFDDFNKKKNFMEIMKQVIVLFVVALVLAFVIELALPYIIELWPKDINGLNLVGQKSFVDSLTDLAKLIKN